MLGSTSFEKNPWNDQDTLVFAQLAYFPIEDYVSKELITPIFVDKLVIQLLQGLENIKNSRYEFLYLLSQTNRYEHMTLVSFKVENDEVREVQFAAFTFAMNEGDKRSLIAFRGTDGSLLGWKENFNMAYSDGVYAQLYAYQYVEHECKRESNRVFWLTGHSKGGNLAIYAYVHLVDKYSPQVIKIVNFDGPSLRSDIFARYPQSYGELEEKLITYVPNSSVIGMLLCEPSNIVVVRSENQFIMEHDSYSWCLNKDGTFDVIGDQTNCFSQLIDYLLDELLDSLTYEDRVLLVDLIYSFGLIEFIVHYKEYAIHRLSYIRETLRRFGRLHYDQKRMLLKLGSIIYMMFAQREACNYTKELSLEWFLNIRLQLNKKFDQYLYFLKESRFEKLYLKLMKYMSNYVLHTIEEFYRSAQAHFYEKAVESELVNVYQIQSLESILNHMIQIQNQIRALDGQLDLFASKLPMHCLIDKIHTKMVDFTMTGSTISENIGEHIFMKGCDWELEQCIHYLSRMIAKQKNNCIKQQLQSKVNTKHQLI